MPAGTPRYWSWFFAAQAAREPLLGFYALMAEWRALMDPGTETDVARIKLSWWQDEIRRLGAGAPSHPITRYIADLPGARSVDFTALDGVLAATAAEVTGVPLERAALLDAHADALYGIPQRLAARLVSVSLRDDAGAPVAASPYGDTGTIGACTAALAVAEYLARAVSDYRREAQRGRFSFPIDELLVAGVENADLCAAVAPPHLQTYLAQQRRRAASHFADAARALGRTERPPLRHLAVLAALGAKHLNSRRHPVAGLRLADLYNAWTAARRAAAAR